MHTLPYTLHYLVCSCAHIRSTAVVGHFLLRERSAFSRRLIPLRPVILGASFRFAWDYHPTDATAYPTPPRTEESRGGDSGGDSGNVFTEAGINDDNNMAGVVCCEKRELFPEITNRCRLPL